MRFVFEAVGTLIVLDFTCPFGDHRTTAYNPSNITPPPPLPYLLPQPLQGDMPMHLQEADLLLKLIGVRPPHPTTVKASIIIIIIRFGIGIDVGRDEQPRAAPPVLTCMAVV